MRPNALVTSARFGAVIALSLFGYGCSSTSNGGGTGGAAAGTGGSAGSTGVGGHVNGLGGNTGGGQGGATDAGPGPSDAAVVTMCSPAPDDNSPCNSNPTCTKNCGLNITALTASRAQKACTCSGANGTWSCPSTNGACVYPTTVNLDCLRLTTPLPLCPMDSADAGTADAGSGLIRPNASTCTVPTSETCGSVCGSATAGVFSYQDSTGVGKVGYCACIAGKYQCASVAEWPTFTN